MKTVTGKVVSSKPISLSTAAKHLSLFASLDNTASNAVRVFLTHGSDAFNGLAQFHKELKGRSSQRKRKGSQQLDSDVKFETSATLVQNPRGEKINNLENKGNRKKSFEFELNREDPLKIERDADGVGGVEVEGTVESNGKDEKNGKFMGKNEEIAQIGPCSDGVVEKRKKKNGKEKLENEAHLAIERGAEEGDEVMKILDDGQSVTQSKTVEVDQDMDGVDGGNVKRRDKKKKKKRRKKSESEEDGESFGGENGKKRKSRDVDCGETRVCRA